MILWRPKRGPVLTYGRAAHLVIGALVPTIGQWAWGYQGLAWASVGVLVAAVLWELATVRLARWLRWSWGYGDVVDLAAFALGVVLAGVLFGLH